MTSPFDPPARPDDDDWDEFEVWSDDPPGDRRTDPARANLLGSLEDDPRVQAGFEHLQRAAREVIAASRAMLDVAEDLVESPGGVTRVLGVLGELGDLAQRVARAQVAGPGPDDDADPDPPVQRIPVS